MASCMKDISNVENTTQTKFKYAKTGNLMKT